MSSHTQASSTTPAATKEPEISESEISESEISEADIIEHETLILGAGPAGVQMGYFLHRRGRDYAILEAGAGPGTFFRSKPRHRRLISINKVHTGYSDPEVNLRFDWNSLLSDRDDLVMSRYSKRYFPAADTLVDYLEDFARELDLEIRTETRVVRVSREPAAADGDGNEDRPGAFLLEDDRGRRYRCRRLVVATGVQVPFMPDIPGIETTENYADIPLDAEDYAGQHVLILGKGNSAFETAEPLIETAAVIHVVSPESLRFAWKTHHVGHLRALNNNFLDTYQLKSQNAVLDAKVESIAPTEDGRYAVRMIYSHASGEEETLYYDRVINCTGFRFDTSIFDEECRPDLVLQGRLPDQTSEWESTNVPGLFFAGTLMQVRDYKKTTSAFIHGFRYNLRCLHRLFEARYQGERLPARSLPATPESLFEAAVERINSSSALWQQFGFLGDVICLGKDGRARYLEEIPMDWVREGRLEALGEEAEDLFTVTLEFGPKQEDPFQILRKPDPAHAQDSAFLHPVIRRFQGGEEVAVLHLLEDLYGEWQKPDAHHKPLREFLETELEKVDGLLEPVG